ACSGTALLGATAGAGLGNSVALRKFPVSGQDELSLAAVAGMLEIRLARILVGHGNPMLRVHIRYLAGFDPLLDGLLQLLLCPLQETAPVANALVLGVKAPINE